MIQGQEDERMKKEEQKRSNMTRRDEQGNNASKDATSIVRNNYNSNNGIDVINHYISKLTKNELAPNVTAPTLITSPRRQPRKYKTKETPSLSKGCRRTNWEDRRENVRKRTYKMRSDDSSDSETSKNKNRDPREVTSNQPATKSQNRGQKETKKISIKKDLYLLWE